MAEQLATTDHLPFFTLRAVRDKVVSMTVLWVGFGIMVGIFSSPPDGGVIRMISGAVAGVIIFPFIGVFLGLIGGQWQPTLAGGVAGLILSLSLGLASGIPELLPTANVGLVSGALVGATFFSYVGIVRKGLAALSQ